MSRASAQRALDRRAARRAAPAPRPAAPIPITITEAEARFPRVLAIEPGDVFRAPDGRVYRVDVDADDGRPDVAPGARPWAPPDDG